MVWMDWRGPRTESLSIRSNTGDEENLGWSMQRNHSKTTDLSRRHNRQPVVSPDDDTLFSFPTAPDAAPLEDHIDGQRPLELTHGVEDSAPSFTSDGQSVVFQSIATESPPNPDSVASGGAERQALR